MFSSIIGSSVSGRNITALSNFNLQTDPKPGATLLIGGMHGDEPATVFLLESFGRKYGGLLGSPVVILSLANPDGFNRNSRYNARGVDINRNFGFNWQKASEEPSGPAAWSEPETIALRELIIRLQPARIVSLHWALAEIDADGPQSTELAFAMWEVLDEEERRPYRVRVYQPGLGKNRLRHTYEICPGSLGQWCGYGLVGESEFPAPAMITLELPYDPAAKERPSPLPTDHLDQLKERWKFDPGGYLAGVEMAVHRMLLAACGEKG
jgi:hypothetical protein